MILGTKTLCVWGGGGGNPRPPPEEGGGAVPEHWPTPETRASFEQGGGRGGGGFGPKTWCTKNGLTRFSLL